MFATNDNKKQKRYEKIEFLGEGQVCNGFDDNEDIR